ncbi:MAG: sigma-E factor regulatory protein RseB domain-containing protein [Armatimonadota bacterium]|nr:sigma-E factor regulatory protein RseB domain-containing protein [Armatimonadota bacterium]
MMRRVALLVAAGLAALAPMASAGSPAAPEPLLGGVTVQEVLRHGALSAQIVDYEGTKVLSVLRGPLMETITVNHAHKRPGLTRLDFLSPDGVAGRVVIDDGSRTWHYEPRLHTVFVGPSVAVPAVAAERLPAERYRVRLLGIEEVIGRPTVVLSLWPQAGRRERRLWIDRLTGVMLRSEERDPDEGLVAVVYFTRISFGLNLPATLFQPRLPAGARVVRQDGPTTTPVPLSVLEQRVGFALHAPAALPGGFRLLGGSPVRDGPVVAAHLHYTDGIRPLALFVAPASRIGPPGRGDPVAGLGEDARTVVVGAMRLVLWRSGDRRLTLVGPLSLAELVRVAHRLGQAP